MEGEEFCHLIQGLLDLLKSFNQDVQAQQSRLDQVEDRLRKVEEASLRERMKYCPLKPTIGG